MSNGEEQPQVFNGQFEVEIVIDRPAANVWPHFLNTASWVTSHDIELVKGSAGAVGSVTRLRWKEAARQNLPSAPYHYCKVVAVVPERQLVLKSYSEAGGSYGMQIVAFDDTRLVPLATGTRVVFNFFVEIRADAVANDPDGISLEASRRGMLDNLHNLKRLVEGA
jgi:hypothetical protein